MPNKLTETEIQKLIPLVEQTKWHYRLDKFTDESLGLINKSINQARREIAAKLAAINPKSEFTKQRLETLAQELQDMTVAIQHKITGQIENTALEVATKSYPKHADILSFGGLVPNFNNVQLTAAQLKSIVDTPLGGKLLNEWVETAFTANIKDKFHEGIATGMLKGESYKNLVKRFKTDAFTGLEKDMEAITRTQVQSINTNAMKDTMAANADIMKGWKWNSVYENRTCIRCMSMDAKDELYPIDGGPQIPLHVNCRCFPEPITKTFRELGVDIDEMEESYRPYTIRGKIDPVTGRVIPGKIGVGGGRIIDTGRFLGSYEDFFKQLPENVQTQMLGPTRFGMYKEGKLMLAGLTDEKGNAFLIKELTKQTVVSPVKAFIVIDDIIEAASKGQSTLRALDNDYEYLVLIKNPEKWLEKAQQEALEIEWKKSSSKLLEKHLKLLDTGDITAVEMKQLLNKAVLEDVINSKAFKNEFVFTKKAVQSKAKLLELKRQKALLKFEKSLSKAELNSIEKWAQYEDSINILKYLKDPEDFLRKNSTAKGLKYKELAKEFTSAVEKAPLASGVKYRGIKNIDEALLKKYTTPGSVLEFDSYASFTSDQKFAERFSGRSRSVIFKIDKEMHDISIMESSKKYKTSEFIEKKGSSYKVISVSTENGYTVVNLETFAKKEARVAKSLDLTISASKQSVLVDDYYKGLSSSEIRAIDNYKGAAELGYSEINGELRESKGRLGYISNTPARKSIREIDSAILKGSMSEDFIIYRGIDEGSFILPNLKEGGRIIDYGFSSATIDKGIASNFAGKDGYLVKIKIKKGSNVGFLSKVDSEGEILLPRHSAVNDKNYLNIVKIDGREITAEWKQ